MSQEITSMEQVGSLRGNSVLGDVEFIRSKVVFVGEGNLLATQTSDGSGKAGATVLHDTVITFNGDNGLVFIDRGVKPVIANVLVNNDNFCYIGADNYFNSRITLQCSEHCNIIIGGDGLFSSNVFVRTSDVHLIYDCETHTRVNESRSVFIGDHVWLGQDARVWKGTMIGSGAVLGASAFCAGKVIPSNTAWGGNPARQIRGGVFHVGASAHRFTQAKTNAWRTYPGDEYIYSFDPEQTVDFRQIEAMVLSASTAPERAEFFLDFSASTAKNRFFVPAPVVDPPRRRWPWRAS
ncbi:MAG: hypothetical protein FWD75_06970 [Propionibacteriaceae bacterium]|nr:hypothetical protein [Propionibacteriaceae bacterium]